MEENKDLNVCPEKHTRRRGQPVRYSKQMKDFLTYLENGSEGHTVADFVYVQSMTRNGYMFYSSRSQFTSFSLYRMTTFLVKRGDIERQNRCKRGYVFYLTTKGKELVKKWNESDIKEGKKE